MGRLVLVVMGALFVFVSANNIIIVNFKSVQRSCSALSKIEMDRLGVY